MLSSNASLAPDGHWTKGIPSVIKEYEGVRTIEDYVACRRASHGPAIGGATSGAVASISWPHLTTSTRSGASFTALAYPRSDAERPARARAGERSRGFRQGA